MARMITQRGLRDASGEIMRELDRGEQFVLTRDGVAVGQLTPLQRRHFVGAEQALAAFQGAPAIDATSLSEDLDELIDQDPNPRR